MHEGTKYIGTLKSQVAPGSLMNMMGSLCRDDTGRHYTGSTYLGCLYIAGSHKLREVEDTRTPKSLIP